MTINFLSVTCIFVQVTAPAVDLWQVKQIMKGTPMTDVVILFFLLDGQSTQVSEQENLRSVFIARSYKINIPAVDGTRSHLYTFVFRNSSTISKLIDKTAPEWNRQ